MVIKEDAKENEPLLGSDREVHDVVYTRTRPSTPYAIYVVVTLTVAYVLNQLCRFVLISTNQSMAQELKFGDKKCLVSNASALNKYLEENKINESGDDYCSWGDGTRCNSQNDFCKWQYTGTGMKYELLVGPLFMVVLSFTGIPVSLVSEARSLYRKNILSICVLGWSVATVVTGWATAYWQVALARMMLALFEAPYLTFASSLASCYFTKKHRSIVIGCVSSGVFVGYGSAFLLALLDEALGWRWTYWISGIPGLAFSFLIFLTVKELKPEKQIVNNEKKLNLTGTLHELKSPIHVILLLAMALRNGGGYVVAYNINNYFKNYYPDYPTEVFMTWSPVVSGCSGTFLGGFLADRLARRWGTIGRMFVIILSSFLGAILFLGVIHTPPPDAFYWFLISATVAELWMGVALSVVIDIVPAQVVTSCLAVYFFSYTLIGGNLNLLVSPMTDAIGWRYTMLVLIVSCFLSSGFLFSIVACLLQLKSSRAVTESDRGLST